MALSAFRFSRSLWKEWKETIRQLVFGGDLLVVLPTGFGKSLIFKLLMRVQEIIMKKAVCYCRLLKSIVQDQISEASSMGLTAVALPVNPDSSSGSMACSMLSELRYPSNSLEIALYGSPFLALELFVGVWKDSLRLPASSLGQFVLTVFCLPRLVGFSPLHSHLNSTTQLSLEVLRGENNWYSELTEIRPLLTAGCVLSSTNIKNLPDLPDSVFASGEFTPG